MEQYSIPIIAGLIAFIAVMIYKKKQNAKNPPQNAAMWGIGIGFLVFSLTKIKEQSYEPKLETPFMTASS